MTDTIEDLNPPDVLAAYRGGSRRNADKKELLRVLMGTHRPALLAGLESEFRFHPTRKWRFDFAWPERRLAVEINGGRYAVNGGRHTSPGDYEKIQAAAALGWRVFPILPEQLARDPLAVLDRLAAALAVS